MRVSGPVFSFPLGSVDEDAIFDEREVQDVFLRLFVFLLQDYRDCLLPMGSARHDPHRSRLPFNSEAFVSRAAPVSYTIACFLLNHT